jgi:hypothetical protein
VTDDEVLIFLEHRGVKGMKWGRRKVRPMPSQSRPPPKDHSTRNAIAITAAIVGGAAVAGIILGKRGNRKALEALKQSEKTVAKSNKLWEGVKQIKLSEMRSPASGSSWEKLPGYPKVGNISVDKINRVLGR